MTDLQCEKCGWIGAESAFIVVQYHDDADLQCPTCNQIICAEEVDWKERCSHAENELADVRHNLAAAVGRVIAANERAKVAEAEVAAWRRAVRWEQVTDHLGVSVDEVWQLRLCNGHPSKLLGYAILTDRGWRASNQHQSVCKLPDRNTACTKVCELLGLPVVLPVGGE